MSGRLSGTDLADLLHGWRSGADTLHASLARRVDELVTDGEITERTMLPSERRLAAALGVSRRTVERAYDSLREGGVLQSRTGVGTWALGPSRRSPRTGRRISTNSFIESLIDGGEQLDLTIASPVAHDLVGRARAATSNQVSYLQSSTPGYFPTGLAELKSEICDWFRSLGAPTSPDEVAITSGAAQGLWLAAATLRRGTEVVIENPTSPTILTALRAHALHVRAARTDGRGLVPTSLPPETGAIVVTSAYLNPTGETLSLSRAADLARRARDGVTVIEDLALADIKLEGPSPAIVAARARRQDPVLSVGSMSKLFWAGLRIGWVRGPAPVIERINQLKASVDIGVPLETQAQAAWLLPQRAAVLADRRPELLERRDHLRRRLLAELPGCSVTSPAGGLSLWLTLPTGARSSAVCRLMEAEGVRLLPARTFDVDNDDEAHLRLPFVAPPEVLDEVVVRLRRVLGSTTGT